MEIAQLTTTRVAPIDFTANTVAELRILNLRDSGEDLSQAQNVIRQCSMQNRSTEQTLFHDHTRDPTAMAGLLVQFSTLALSMEIRHVLIQHSQVLNILNLHLQGLLREDITILSRSPLHGGSNFHALVPRRYVFMDQFIFRTVLEVLTIMISVI